MAKRVGCIILCGGESLRLGFDKATVTIGNQNLLERSISLVDPLADEIIVVSSKEKCSAQLTTNPKVRMTADIYPKQGPLGGIHAGLSVSKSSVNLVVACDMPFLNHDLLRYMVRIADGYDVVVPRIGSLLEPLHAVYSKSCLPVIEGLLKDGVRKTDRLFSLVRVRYVKEAEINRFDLERLSLFNINTKQDLERAQEIAGMITRSP
ncbi:MAG: molybdenum cofactor guanylyltransferase [Dehalococcoidales bacterium]|nr:molybdenum cofactor guanylyltransferase [Dehalococcoidales bacterium]